MKIEIGPKNKITIQKIGGGQVFKHRNGYYIAGQGGPSGKRDCVLLETGKNYQFGNNTSVEAFPKATLYLD